MQLNLNQRWIGINLQLKYVYLSLGIIFLICIEAMNSHQKGYSHLDPTTFFPYVLNHHITIPSPFNYFYGCPTLNFQKFLFFPSIESKVPIMCIAPNMNNNSIIVKLDGATFPKLLKMEELYKLTDQTNNITITKCISIPTIVRFNNL